MNKVSIFFLMLLVPYICQAQIKIDGFSYSIYSRTNTMILEKAPVSLEGDVKIPGSVIYKGNTYKVTHINDHAFEDCSNITSIDLPVGIVYINGYAFKNCTNLRVIKIPRTVKSIGPNAFANCFRLEDVYCQAENVPDCKRIFYGLSLDKATLHVPTTYLYSDSEEWNIFGKIDNNMIKQEETKRNKTVNVSQPSIVTIDLGLSVKWASMNIGASKPSEMGNPYAWGEHETKTKFSKEVYDKPKYEDDSYARVRFYTYGINGTKYDTARVLLGKNWRLPTYDEFRELISKCKKIVHKISETSKTIEFVGPNGNSIIFPFTHLERNEDAMNIYWSCIVSGNSYEDRPWVLDDNGEMETVSGYYGGFIRAVYVE